MSALSASYGYEKIYSVFFHSLKGGLIAPVSSLIWVFSTSAN